MSEYTPLWPKYRVDLVRRYAAQGMPGRRVGEILGVGRGSILSVARRYGIKFKGREILGGGVCQKSTKRRKLPTSKIIVPVKPTKGLYDLLTAPPRTCRYFTGAINQKSLAPHVCGRPSIHPTSYCADHVTQMYTPLRNKQRATKTDVEFVFRQAGIAQR